MKFIVQLVFILIGSMPLFPQSPWTFQNPAPTGADLKGLDFFDRQNGWAVGVFGAILHTSDEGATWQLQHAGTTKYLYGAAARSATTCFVVGANGTLLKTTDAGASWTSIPTGRTGAFMAITFVTPKVGFILEGINSGGTKVLKTTDGGENWNVYATGSTETLYAMAFADTLNGFIVGGGLFGTSTILRTTNGGETWNLQANPTTYSLYGVYAVDTVAWAVGYNGVILRTKLNLSAWEPVVPGNINTKDLNAVTFIDSVNGFAGGLKGEARRTTNGGTTWTTIMSDFMNWKTIRAVDFADAKYGYLAGERGKIMKTTDGGASWKHLDNAVKPELLNLAFSNKDTATCVGYEYTDIYLADGKIYQTTNGGVSWTLRQTSLHYPLYSVTYPTPAIGYAAGHYGTVYKTEDYGKTWQPKNISFTGKILGLFFLSPSYGVAVGDSGAAFVTGDGGTSWLRKPTGTNKTLNYLTFTKISPQDSSLTGFAVGSNGVVLRTLSGGQTWEVLPSFTTASLYGVHFIEGKGGWVAGSGSTVYRTTDGGANWVKQTLPSSTTLQAICFSNERSGFAVGWYGGIYGTTNGGEQWYQQLVTTNSLYAVTMVDSSTGWILGDAGTILKTTTGAITAVRATQQTVTRPASYVLEQNYPNPFNPTTTIRFGVPEASMVRLTVYDLLGRRVAELMNGPMEAGYREVVWNAQTAAGVYFCTIDCRSLSSAGERYTQTRKLLLTK